MMFVVERFEGEGRREEGDGPYRLLCWILICIGLFIAEVFWSTFLVE
jgi:hypothetical protein